jgi:hypothetical protein
VFASVVWKWNVEGPTVASVFSFPSVHGLASRPRARLVFFSAVYTYRPIQKYGAPQNYGPCATAQAALL